MIYCSIDLETTGLNAEKYQILTFSGILENTEKKLSLEQCPKINIYILRDEIIGSPFAINMNSRIIASISRYQNLKTDEEKDGLRESLGCVFLYPQAVPYYFYVWILVHQEGRKEYEFHLDPKNWKDHKLTEIQIRTISSLRETVGPLTINVAGKNFATFDKKFIDQIEKFYHFVRFRQRVLDPSVLFTNWKSDLTLPDLTVCKERAGLDPFVSHDSLDDAWDVIQLFRKVY
jgi:DNA polymerase III epsilon subunit-like protein